MKKNLLFASALAVLVSFFGTSCSDNNDDPKPNPGQESAELDYTTANAEQWGNYMMNTARLLKSDADKLYTEWAEGYASTGRPYAELFKEHNAATGFTSLQDCAQQVVEKMGEIANEVGSTKMGDPYSKWTQGKKELALYSVESWYSWHSRDDYTNNIKSIRNAYYGSLDGTVAEHSMAAAIAKKYPEFDQKMRNLIQGAQDAIQGITQPFRSHIGSTETVAAMDACEKLQRALSEIDSEEEGEDKVADATNLRDLVVKIDADELQLILNNYVDAVVVPTYKALREKNNALKEAVDAFAANPTNAGFVACSKAWMEAREPWETSEAFLFGPVDEYGLDPNMDSWPLDQDAIVQIMKSQKWTDLEWTPGDDDAKVESAQNVRGFHTLEFLVFKNGQPRTVPAK